MTSNHSISGRADALADDTTFNDATLDESVASDDAHLPQPEPLHHRP